MLIWIKYSEIEITINVLSISVMKDFI